MYLSQVQSTATTTSANPALSPDVTTPMSDTTRAPLKQVFEKVWVEVDKRSIVLRDRVFKELTDMSLSMEQQERNIIFLIDLDVPEDPVWFFFRSQHAWISGLFETEMRVFATTMEGRRWSDGSWRRITMTMLNFDGPLALVRAHGDAIALVQRQKAELADKDTASADDLKSHQRQARLASTKFKRSVQAVISNNFESMFGRT